jgi:hypothetical protein
MSCRNAAGTLMLLWVCLFVFQPAESAQAQLLDHFPIHSFETESLDRLFLEIGESPPFYSRPFSNYVFLRHLRYLKSRSGRLSKNNRQILDTLLTRLSEQESHDRFLVPVLESSLRLQYQSEEISPRQEYLYYRESLEETPLLNLGLLAGVPSFLIHAEMDIRRDFFSSFRPGNFTNLPIGDIFYQEFDFTFPTKGYLKVGGPAVDLTVGRDRLKWGPGYRGSLVLSDSPPYYDMLTVSYRAPAFAACFFYASLESYLTAEEYAEQLAKQDEGAINFGKDGSGQYKFLAGHRFELKIKRKITLGLNDLIVVGGRLLEFNEITPLMFLHNVYGENYSNVILGFDASVVPCRNLQLYAELAIDDIRNVHEDESSPPTSLAWLAGLWWLRPLDSGNWSFRFEWARVDPWTYNRWQPYLMFTSRKKFLSTAMGKQILDFPTGYFLGPDVQSFYWLADYERGDKLAFGLGYELRQKGRVYLDILDPESEYDNYVTVGSSTPTGTVLTSHIITLAGRYRWSPHLSVTGVCSVGYRLNREHVAGDDGAFTALQLNCNYRR